MRGPGIAGICNFRSAAVENDGLGVKAMTIHIDNKALMQTARGRKIGRVERVVIDPETGAVTHLVVKNGRLPGREKKVIPFASVKSGTAGRLELSPEVNRPDAYPTFDQSTLVPVGGVEDFQRQKSRQAAWMAWFYTRAHNPWWQAESASFPTKPVYAHERRRNIPNRSIPLAEGAPVTDAAGKPVGEVAEIDLSSADRRVTHVAVACGRFTSARKRIPVGWVQRFSERGIRLSVKKSSIEALPCRTP